MSMEVLVIIVSMAEFARLTRNKPMYDYAAALTRGNGINLIPYEFETGTPDQQPPSPPSYSGGRSVELSGMDAIDD
jgi:hypothetical protein